MVDALGKKDGGGMRRVIIESPFAGNTDKNIQYARSCLRDSLMRGESPYASHLLYTQPGVLDDNHPDERKRGIDAGLMWADGADLVAVYTDLGLSDGMKYGISAHQAAGRTIEYRSIFNINYSHKGDPNGEN